MNLLVFALKEEDLLPDYPGFTKIYTGVGKVNAAMKLTEIISNMYSVGDPPDLVINFGTAGGISLKKDAFVECRQFVQLDMKCEPLGLKEYQTPGEIFVSLANEDFNHETYTAGTSDTFITNKKPFEDSADLVDMEAYALAKVCNEYGVKFKCFKYITDECDTNSPSDWKQNIEKAKIHFEEVMKKFV